MGGLTSDRRGRAAASLKTPSLLTQGISGSSVRDNLLGLMLLILRKRADFQVAVGLIFLGAMCLL